MSCCSDDLAVLFPHLDLEYISPRPWSRLRKSSDFWHTSYISKTIPLAVLFDIATFGIVISGRL